ncbi:MAG: hypothetical protein ACD_7C00379G0009 [uncultured bacterium]|nr:MAG: hypothetical protein ACD_7C00379G0009 [uncultured bacterium]HBR78924.1 hypothetical protein [Candidatus Moranbacteria bacterium]
MEYFKIIGVVVIIIAALAIFYFALKAAASGVREFINEVVPLKREITKTEGFVITLIIFLLIANN